MRLSVLLVLPAAAVPLAGQRDVGDAALARGDTAAAIAAYERADDDAAAQYHAGRLLLTRHIEGLMRSESLDRARAAFARATELAPDSAAYWLGYAESYRAAGDLLSRMQVGRLIERAYEVGHRTGRLPADVAYRAARVQWERYEGSGNRWLFAFGGQTLAPEILLGEWDELQAFFGRDVRPDPGRPGAALLAEAESRLRTALAADPAHIDAAGLLAVVLGEGDQWEEAGEVTALLVRAAPDSGRAWAVRGLALTRLGRWAAATAAYRRALRLMSPRAAERYRDLGAILRPGDVGRWRRMSPEERRQLTRLYWTAAEPLYLDSLNEARTEFYARATYVHHRWSDPLRRVEGRETDRGAVYLRYGPPDVWATFAPGAIPASASGMTDAAGAFDARTTAVVWLYNATQLRFLFAVQPGFGTDRLSGDFSEVFRVARDLMPIRFDNVPAARVDTIFVQFTQFRGARPGTTDLGVFAFLPLGRLTAGAPTDTLPLTMAAILKNPAMEDVHRSVREEAIAAQDPDQVQFRTWRFNLPSGEYLLRVEARLGLVNRTARSTSLLNLNAYAAPDTVALSDVLVAEAVGPQDSTWTSWRDFFIRPSVGWFGADDPIALLWETYGLTPDSTGSVHYTIDLTVTVHEVERRNFAARILGGIADAVGLSARGDEEVALRYERSASVAERQVDYMTVLLEDAPAGRYTITVLVTDLVSGHTASARRAITVTRVEATP